MQEQAQSVKAAVDASIVLTGIATFIADVMPTVVLVLAAVLSLIRIVNEWPQLRKTMRSWFWKR